MTECDRIQEILPAYLEGLASPPESEMVSSHLASCSECNSTVRAMMKSQRLIANLEEVEPPPWLKTRIMARLEEGVEQEEEKQWGFRRLKHLLLYPLKVKIPLQAFAVLVVAFMAVYVYRVTQPELKLAEQSPKNVATAPAPAEKKDSTPEAKDSQKGAESTVVGSQQSQPQSQPQAPAKPGAEEVEKWPSGIREIFRSDPAQQLASPQALKMPEATVADQDNLRAASEPEARNRTKAAKAAPPNISGISGAPSAPAPAAEDRGKGDVKAEKGAGIPSGVRQEALVITVQVADIKTGTSDVEAVLRSLNAPVVKESREGSNVISTTANPSKAREIAKRLSTVGHVQQRNPFSETASDKPVPVRIQVLQK